MARLAIFIDGGYLDRLASAHLKVWIDYEQFSKEIATTVDSRTPEPVDIVRTYYYHCLPYQSNPPTADEARRYAQKHKLFERLRYLDRYEVREGHLAFRGVTAAGEPIFQQKRVDLLLGLDFALLASKQRVTHIAVVSGDSDLVPAFDVARQEGVSLWLFHGPRRQTVADELFRAADERVEIDQAFASRVAMPPRQPS